MSIRNIRFLLAAILVGGFAPASARAYCGMSNAQVWAEFYSLLGADVSNGPGNPLVIVLGAPWCPYCANTFKAYQSKRYNFDVRFVPQDAVSPVHRDQLAYIVADGTSKALAQVYVQRSRVQHGLPTAMYDFINEVQEVTLHAAQWKFETIGTPTTFFWRKNGKIGKYSGMPNLAEIEREIDQTPPPANYKSSRKFLKSGVPVPKPVSGQPYAKSDNTKVRILPDENAFTVECLRAGMGFPVAAVKGLVTIDGEQWLAFSFAKDVPKLTSYGRASDFTNWSTR